MLTRRKTLLGAFAFLVPNTGFAFNPNKIEIGKATFYKDSYTGRFTANQERFSQARLTAAHRTAPLGSKARVTNRNTGQSVVVRINDRLGKTNAIIDLSWAAAQGVGITRKSGWAEVSVEFLLA